MELLLAPVMFPIAAGYATLCHFHRQVSRYIPNIVSMEEDSTTVFHVVPAVEEGPNTYNVYDQAKKLRYSFRGSKFSKGMFNFHQCDPSTEEMIPLGTVSVGVWSSFSIFKPIFSSDLDELTTMAIGKTSVKHQSDALDNYRVIKVAHGNVYQWSKRGKALERVYNLGQKDSEVRERVAHVQLFPNNEGYMITVDDRKVFPPVALMTSMISFLDQWNTLLGVGGLYYPVKHGELPWRRV